MMSRYEGEYGRGERLNGTNVDDYCLCIHERVAAYAVKRYLAETADHQTVENLEEIFGNRTNEKDVCKEEIDRKALEDLIGESIQSLIVLLRETITQGQLPYRAAATWNAVLCIAEAVNPAETAENISREFLEFLAASDASIHKAGPVCQSA